tara:strand:+ start:179533 stop:180426 length:894 start_codon:yes stop_codon:yes gene_type:complete
LNIRIERTLPGFGLAIVTINLIFNILGFEILSRPFGAMGTMTLLTSVSMVLVFLTSFDRSKLKNVLGVIVGLQVFSVVLHFINYSSDIPFLQPSSFSTIGFILTFTFFKFLAFKKVKVSAYGGGILTIMCVTFLFGFLNDEMFILGVSSDRIGVGLSPYTFVCFVLMTSIYWGERNKFVSLENLRLSYSPIWTFSLLVAYAFLNFLIIFCPAEHVAFWSILIQGLFLLLFYKMLVKPFLHEQGDLVQMCAWTNQFKTKDGEWVSQKEFFESLGVDITHGIAPEAAKKLREKNHSKKV